ncbi:MAG: inorganic diphosphatase [Saprospiraceae bacterium]
MKKDIYIQTNISHPWHGVDSNWENNLINAVVEIPKGERSKFEIDKESGLIKLDRVLSGSQEYPTNYGIIPRTLGEDGDPLDILVLSNSPLPSLCLVRCRILGAFKMQDQGIPDDKILAVADKDATLSHLKSMDDLPDHFKNELKHFFEQYTVLENKTVNFLGFESYEAANLLITKCRDRYQHTYAMDKIGTS